MRRFSKRLSFGLREKLFVLLAVPILLTIGAIALLSTNAQTSAINRQYESKAKAIIDGFNADIISLDLSTAHLQSELETYVRLDPGVFKITVYATKGDRVVRIASTSQEQIGTEAAPEDMEPFRTNRTFWHEDTSEGIRFVEVLAPIRASGSGETVAAIGVYMNLKPRDEAIRTQRLILIGAGALGTLFLLSLLYWALNKLILKPITDLAEATVRVAKGDYEAKVTVASTDELGELARSVNQMTNALALQKERLDDQFNELGQTNAKLEEANRAKSSFLAMVSHELRTPLSSVIGFSELLTGNVFGQLNEAQMRYANNIHSSGKHLLQLVNDIMDLSRVDSGGLKLHAEEFSVASVLEDVESAMRSPAGQKQISMATTIEPVISSVEADPIRFKQVMLNLVNNAIRFTPEGGCVNISAQKAGDFLLISVADTGIGIASEDQERIFAEFQRAGTTPSSQHEGTGLGLALTRRLVEMHGGRIWVVSQVGEGSTFSFVIPLHPEVEQAPPAPRPSAERPVSDPGPLATVDKPLILLVEGDRGSSETFSEWLTDAGYRIARAFDGEQAVRLAYELEPFVIALDLALPKKDGWQVLRDLKTLPDTRDIPVVIISALQVGNKGFSLGAVDYFTKPIDRDRLVDRLDKLGFVRGIKPRQTSILVVDDRPEAVELLTEILRPQGVEIIKAYGDRQAISFALEHLPDLIILDLVMPDVNGFDVVAELKKHQAARRIPIIILTAKELTSQDIEKLDRDVQAIIQKHDFTKEELLAEIAKLEAIYPDKARLVDPESDLLTRAGFRRRLSQAIRMAERYNTPVTLIQARAIRATVGASENAAKLPAECSKDLTRLLKSVLKPDELAADLGEGYFAVILPHAEKSIGAVRARELQRSWSTYRYQQAGSNQTERLITSSVVVSFPIDAAAIEQLVAKAQEQIDVQMKRRVGGPALR